MNEWEGFVMYAINIDKPYIITEKDIPKFIENGKKHRKIVEKICSLFGMECFDFKKDEDGCMVVEIDVERPDIFQA